MKREYWVTIVVIVFLLGSVVLKFVWQARTASVPAAKVTERETLSTAGYPEIASVIAGRINELSPTPSFDETGWLARKISFSSAQSLAYVDYTDTHVLLRLLLEYKFSDQTVQTKVLATFLPDASGSWQRQFGQDEGAGLSLVDYVYNGDSKQWVPQILINN
jgi:hypothetical protein